ncbi:hypothetical protein HDU98_008756 [Podochytrium sp. JEL0797]|nr:hypothetical protein HDU98_008754 [Podochytrium sp. JEL0797]KAJ3075278.1 hypothetical protein HDU98_008756 [Podochytrium sp. JEL0797]
MQATPTVAATPNTSLEPRLTSSPTSSTVRGTLTVLLVVSTLAFCIPPVLAFVLNDSMDGIYYIGGLGLMVGVNTAMYFAMKPTSLSTAWMMVFIVFHVLRCLVDVAFRVWGLVIMLQEAGGKGRGNSTPAIGIAVGVLVVEIVAVFFIVKFGIVMRAYALQVRSGAKVEV